MLAESRAADGHASGDFFAFEQQTPDHLTMVIGDACGRGREGAKLLPNLWLRLAELADCAAPPSCLLDELNQRLAVDMPSDRFVTGAAFQLDARLGKLTVANAGHVPAMLRSAHGHVTVIGRASGPPLGLLSSSNYAEECYDIGKGDLLVFMTDGVLEALETDLARMPTLLALMAQAPTGGCGAQAFLLGKLDRFASDRAADDRMLLSLEVIEGEVVNTTESATFLDLEQAI